jgi:sulfatase modifying factor 1
VRVFRYVSVVFFVDVTRQTLRNLWHDGSLPGLVWVPAGRFPFGDRVYPEEQPITDVTVAGFWMDRTEVTNDQFAEFVKATGHVTVAERPVDAQAHPGLPAAMREPGAVVFVNPVRGVATASPTDWWRYTPGASWRHPQGPGSSIAGRGTYPVVAVAYEDAMAYARWKGRSLPTEIQWEWAARGGQGAGGGPEHQDGDGAQPAQANTWQGLFPVLDTAQDGFGGAAPVGCFAANGYGLFDMIGNVWELTADEYTDSHAFGPLLRAGGPMGTASGATRRVIKGGSFLCAPNYCRRYRAGARQPQEDDLATSHLGFRTVLNAPGPPAGPAGGSDTRR